MSSADFNNAKVLYASTAMDEDAWVKVFTADPGVMWQILGDVSQSLGQRTNATVVFTGKADGRHGSLAAWTSC
jgi:hypothetical protein